MTPAHRILVALCVLLPLLPVPGRAQDPGGAAGDAEAPTNASGLPLLVDVELSRDEITVGDRVEATVLVVWMGEETAEPARFPVWQESWGRAEVLGVGEVDEVRDASGRRIWKQRVTLTAFRPGEVTLPPVQLALPLADRTVEARTERITFTVGSVLPEPEEPAAETEQPSAAEPEIPEPKGAAGAMSLEASQEYFWWSTGALSLLLLAGLLWTASAVAHQPPETQTVLERIDPLRLLSPFGELRERLQRLDPAAGAEPVHTGLSFAFRTYLGRRLRFRAVESTTTEIQRVLRRAALSAELCLRATKLLRDVDAVKFARAEVAAEVTRRRLAEAGDLGQEIERQMAPTPRLEDVQAEEERAA